MNIACPIDSPIESAGTAGSIVGPIDVVGKANPINSSIKTSNMQLMSSRLCVRSLM